MIAACCSHHSQLKYFRDEKVKVLKAIPSLSLSSTVLGQYEADPESEDPDAKNGYLDDPTVSIRVTYAAYSLYFDIKVPAASLSPTFAAAVLKINNERWDGVPFMIKCGKALNERKVEVRISMMNISTVVSVLL
jgi:glucose-6-phosphate 1-dehydrogenase